MISIQRVLILSIGGDGPLGVVCRGVPVLIIHRHPYNTIPHSLIQLQHTIARQDIGHCIGNVEWCAVCINFQNSVHATNKTFFHRVQCFLDVSHEVVRCILPPPQPNI
jgi:hypothetical protein